MTALFCNAQVYSDCKAKIFAISQSKQVDINLVIHIMLTGQKIESETHLVK